MVSPEAIDGGPVHGDDALNLDYYWEKGNVAKTKVYA